MSSWIQEAETVVEEFSGGAGTGQPAQKTTTTTSTTSFGGGLKQTMEDGVINQLVDQELNKFGIPAAADGYVNKALDKEANEFF